MPEVGLVAGRCRLMPFPFAWPLLWFSPPKTAPNEGKGMNDRGLVCTMLGLWIFVCGAGGRQRARRGQRGACGKAKGKLEQCARDWSSVLEGKEELGVEKAFFQVEVSAS